MQAPQDAILHAIESYPAESCGVVVNGKYIRCRNVSDKPGGMFVMHKGDYQDALSQGDIEAIVHSHPDYSVVASDADLLACYESAVPWCIIEIRASTYVRHRWYEPKEPGMPLIGREFFHGKVDCLTTILDYYKREMGIDLGQYDREDDWWDKGQDLYRYYLPKAGFEKLPQGAELQTGDVILMQIRSPVPNHGAVFIKDGLLKSENAGHPVPDCILHHLPQRLSRRDPYGGYYLEKTVEVWRYV